LAELSWWYIPLLLAGAGLTLTLAWKPLRAWLREVRAERARELFHLQRERLQECFLETAGASDKPRGLRWAECQWASDVHFARDRRNGDIYALVGLSVRFEPTPGSLPEDWPTVDQYRQATGVFCYHKGEWQTQGRCLFNLAPLEALARFGDQYEPL
jgi:hypothetical protein